MKLIFSSLILCILLPGCAIFKTPAKTVEAPAAPQTYAEQSQAWSADVVKQQRAAEREKFESDLRKSANEDPAK